MRLPPGGIDIYYIDESTDRDLLVMVAVPVPFLRFTDGLWNVVWPDHFADVRAWKRQLSRDYDIPVQKELKGSKLAAGRGRYLKGKHQLQRAVAAEAYRGALRSLDFLAPGGVITAVGTPSSTLYGHGRLEAVLYALLQRMRRTCEVKHRLGMVFFDEGHGEYRKLYRKAQVYLPTGSSQGAWASGAASRNMPLDNFVKDANTKDSQHSLYTQVADIISFAALTKFRAERNGLTDWQAALNLGTLYDEIPRSVLNTKASRNDPLGIVRLT